MTNYIHFEDMIKEGNLLCAKYIDPVGFEKKKDRAGFAESLHYHEDYLFLIPVIEKIEFEDEPEIRFVMYPDECQVQRLEGDGFFHTLLTYNSESRIKSAFGAVHLYLKNK